MVQTNDRAATSEGKVIDITPEPTPGSIFNQPPRPRPTRQPAPTGAELRERFGEQVICRFRQRWQRYATDDVATLPVELAARLRAHEVVAIVGAVPAPDPPPLVAGAHA